MLQIKITNHQNSLVQCSKYWKFICKKLYFGVSVFIYIEICQSCLFYLTRTTAVITGRTSGTHSMFNAVLLPDRRLPRRVELPRRARIRCKIIKRPTRHDRATSQIVKETLAILSEFTRIPVKAIYIESIEERRVLCVAALQRGRLRRCGCWGLGG